MKEELVLLESIQPKDVTHAYRENFSKKLADSIHGSTLASVQVWGETIQMERVNGGRFLPAEEFIDEEVGNADHKLFGGAQYHRALRDFSVAVRHMRPVSVSDDEIANAAGVGDTHDGVNVMRTACVLALDKAQEAFDPMLDVLRSRCEHIMKRLYPIINSMIDSSAEYSQGEALRRLRSQEMLGSSDELVVKRVFDKFVEDQISLCLEKCRDDLRGITRFVTWDISNKDGAEFLSILRNSSPRRDASTTTELYTLLGVDAESNGGSDHYQPTHAPTGLGIVAPYVGWRSRVNDILQDTITSFVRRLIGQTHERSLLPVRAPGDSSLHVDLSRTAPPVRGQV